MGARLFAISIALTAFVAFAIPVGLVAQNDAAQSKKAQHHHYQLIDIGTLPGRSIYNTRVTSNGSTPTEFQQVLNNQGVFVGGADTPTVNPFPNCFNPSTSLSNVMSSTPSSGTETSSPTLAPSRAAAPASPTS